MGSGSFNSGKFKLNLTFNYDADATKIDQWKTAFDYASRLLYDATDAQMQFGEITIRNNGYGLDMADGRLDEDGLSDWLRDHMSETET